jgi:hypothetical protein
MDIPIYIFHLGNHLYFQKCVDINSNFNKVHIIGDDSNKFTFKNNANVFHHHIDEFNTSTEIQKMKTCFQNYSTNAHTFEFLCFLRVFYLKELILKTSITRFFHVDSDCIVLEQLHKIPFASAIAYSLHSHQPKEMPYIMAGSIHNALLNLDFCNTFITLCFDVYDNKSKMNLLQPKIDWHCATKTGGGICDMTFYWLLHTEKLVQVEDLNTPRIIDGEMCVFDHQLNSSYGYQSCTTFKKTEKNIKEILSENKKVYFITLNGLKIRTLSIHFQGSEKELLAALPSNYLANHETG